MSFSFVIPLACLIAEKVIGRGKGDEKKSLAQGILKLIKGVASRPGVSLPEDAELGDLIEAEVKDMNAKRLLVGEKTIVGENTFDLALVAMGLRLNKEAAELFERAGVK